MPVHYLKPQRPCSSCETEMHAAPFVILPNGMAIVPQQYLQFEQTIVSLQEILSAVETLPQFLLFADEDGSGLYLQVGMIGRENYDRSNASRQQKLVYGRKWRIDANTPSSEVIQTAFLAVKKAREHEVREMFTLVDAASNKTSAPFSTHQDIPLMANHSELLAPASQHAVTEIKALQEILRRCLFGERSIELMEVLAHKNKLILDFKLGVAPQIRREENELPEFDGFEFTLVLSSLQSAPLLHEIMEAFIRCSDETVAESFSYNGFKRFSRSIDPANIATLSIASRPYARDMNKADFVSNFRTVNYQTDASRVPKLGAGPLADRNRATILAVNNLLGHMPVDLWQQDIAKRWN